MDEIKQNPDPDDTQLHWFWKLTTKWWFFPVFYLSLNLLVFLLAITMFSITSADFEYVLFYILMMPSGLSHLFLTFWKYLFQKSELEWYFFLINIIVTFVFFIPFFISSIIRIPYYRYKKNQILRKNIITLFLLISISFLGLVFFVIKHIK